MIGGRSLRFRRLREADIDAVMAIDDVAYPHSWSRRLYLDDVDDADRGVHLVALRGRKVVGHGGVLFLDTDAHVSTIAVDPRHTGEGIGTELLVRLVAEAIAAGSEAMTLEVRVGNERAQELYRRAGFAPVGVRPGYYKDPDGPVDALIMWLHDLDESTLDRVGQMLAAPVASGGFPS